MVDYGEIVLKLKQEGDIIGLELAQMNYEQKHDLIECLLKILHDQVASIPLNNNVENYKYLYKILKYLEEYAPDYGKRKTFKNLNEIEKICNKRIGRALSSKHNRCKTKVLEKIKDIIDVTKMSIDYYAANDNKEVRSYNLLICLIFEIKNYNYLFEIIKTYPNKIIAKNEDGKYLIEELVDRYLCEVVKNESLGEIIYLEKVIKLFIDNPKLKISNGAKTKIIDKLNNSINEINNIFLPYSQKQKIVFFINEIITYIETKKYTKTEIIDKIKCMMDSDFSIVKKEEADFISYYLNILYKTIIDQKYDSKISEQLNHYIMDIDKFNIKNEIKDELINLAKMVIKYLSNNIATSQMYNYLDYKYNINYNYNDSVIDEAKNIVILNGEQVLDCTNKFTITIDKSNTRVYDDAISLERFDDGTRLLGIYLADCASFIKRGSAIDLKAFSLGQTVMSIQRYHSMLAPDLVEKLTLCSNNNRRAIGHFFLLDKDMNCISFSVKKCLINVHENYDYEKSNILLTDSRNIEEVKLLKEMLVVSNQISKLNYAKQEFRTVKKLKREIIYQEKVKDTLSSFMISDFMIYLNSYIANFFNSHPEIPFVYRNNLSNYSEDIIKRVNEIMINDYDSDCVLSYINLICPPSYYSTINEGHRGLNLDAYCHATNPLRNYCSLETQRLIEKYIINKDMNVPENEDKRLHDLCEYMNSRINMNNEYVEESYSLENRIKKLTK